MGDRANFGFRQADGDTIYLYGHWAGHQMMARLANAIEVARPRWTDESYATRIAISRIIGNEWDQEYSWGISTHIGDNEHSVPVVDWSAKTVTLYPHEWGSGMDLDNPKFTMDLDSFVNKFSKSLTYA
jgi:hypothetical protein